MTGTAASLVFNADGTVTFEGQTRPLAEISEIRVTGSGGDDTFTIDFGGTDPGITIGFDGAVGYDTLVTKGNVGGFASYADRRLVGLAHLRRHDGPVLGHRADHEQRAGGDATFTLERQRRRRRSSRSITIDPTMLRLRSLNAGFESTSVHRPDRRRHRR